MNPLLQKLTCGPVASDGCADEVAAEVLANPVLFGSLAAGLDSPDDVVRARTAHALEKVARGRPALIAPLLGELIRLADSDPLPAVRWHIPMIFSDVARSGAEIAAVLPVLLRLLKDESTFVRGWTIAALAVIARRDVSLIDTVIRELSPFTADPSPSVRSRAAKAFAVLRDKRPLPAGWYKGKSSHSEINFA
jgi:HEAT repeat protein